MRARLVLTLRGSRGVRLAPRSFFMYAAGAAPLGDPRSTYAAGAAALELAAPRGPLAAWAWAWACWVGEGTAKSTVEIVLTSLRSESHCCGAVVGGATITSWCTGSGCGSHRPPLGPTSSQCVEEPVLPPDGHTLLGSGAMSSTQPSSPDEWPSSLEENSSDVAPPIHQPPSPA